MWRRSAVTLKAFYLWTDLIKPVVTKGKVFCSSLSACCGAEVSCTQILYTHKRLHYSHSLRTIPRKPNHCFQNRTTRVRVDRWGECVPKQTSGLWGPWVDCQGTWSQPDWWSWAALQTLSKKWKWLRETYIISYSHKKQMLCHRNECGRCDVQELGQEAETLFKDVM